MWLPKGNADSPQESSYLAYVPLIWKDCCCQNSGEASQSIMTTKRSTRGIMISEQRNCSSAINGRKLFWDNDEERDDISFYSQTVYYSIAWSINSSGNRRAAEDQDVIRGSKPGSRANDICATQPFQVYKNSTLCKRTPCEASHTIHSY